MRGWFVIHDVSGGSHMIKRAHIIEQGTGEVTDVEIIGDELHVVNTTNSEVLKVLVNGQVVIIRDGIRYNVCGQRIE